MPRPGGAPAIALGAFFMTASKAAAAAEVFDVWRSGEACVFGEEDEEPESAANADSAAAATAAETEMPRFAVAGGHEEAEEGARLGTAPPVFGGVIPGGPCSLLPASGARASAATAAELGDFGPSTPSPLVFRPPRVVVASDGDAAGDLGSGPSFGS